MAAKDLGENVTGVIGHGDGAAVAEDDDVGADGAGGGGDGGDLGGALVERFGGDGADGAAGGDAHVGDDDVGARIRGMFTLTNVEEKSLGQLLVHHNVMVDIDITEKPALTADWISLLVL